MSIMVTSYHLHSAIFHFVFYHSNFTDKLTTFPAVTRLFSLSRNVWFVVDLQIIFCSKGHSTHSALIRFLFTHHHSFVEAFYVLSQSRGILKSREAKSTFFLLFHCMRSLVDGAVPRTSKWLETATEFACKGFVVPFHVLTQCLLRWQCLPAAIIATDKSTFKVGLHSLVRFRLISFSKTDFTYFLVIDQLLSIHK